MSISRGKGVAHPVLHLVLVCLFVIAIIGPAQATERIHLTLDSVDVYQGQTGYLSVWLTNPSDSIAGFQIWVRLNRPDLVTFANTVDTAGTILSGWEYIDVRSLVGDGYDLQVTAFANTLAPPLTPAYPPYLYPHLLARLPINVVGNPDTLFDKFADVYIETSLLDKFSFSNPSGDDIVVQQTIVEDTECYRCLQMVGEICLEWQRVAGPPCESTFVSIDTIAVLDTAAVHIDNSRITLAPCTIIPLPTDVNNDGSSFTVADLVELNRFVSGEIAFLQEPLNADLNGDCKISWDDYRALANYFEHGGPPIFPGCTCPLPVRVCCDGSRGNVSSQMDQKVDLTDLSMLIAYMVVPGSALKCMDEANLNGAGAVDLSDLSILINYMVQGGELPSCP
jgi:hypothetical protein